VTTVLRAAGVCLPAADGGHTGPSPQSAPGWIAFDGGRIVETGTGPGPADATDLGSAVLAPAFVDLQVNGLGAVDLAVAEAGAVEALARELARRGVGAFCPTLTTREPAEYGPWLARVDRARSGSGDAAPEPAAALLGAHLEGPFLGDAPGAHDPALFRPADPVWLDELVASHPGRIAVVTLAPEADPGLEATAGLAAAGVAVALGHSRATYEAVEAAADAGASMVTHLFNGMDPMHHRAPGLVGAALADPRLTPTVIADCVHVHPAVLTIVCAAKSRLALVSDTVATTGAPGAPREVGGAARLPDGTLAGATVTIDRAVANLCGLGVPLPRAVAMAGEIPAGLVGASDRGRLDAGARADVVALDPVDATVLAVWLGGVAVPR
jgi:N-acetylglucosamine-6-phosphate deacetylase